MTYCTKICTSGDRTSGGPPVQQEHQNWTGGALNITKLMGMKISFPKILGKLRKIKLSENLMNFENLKEKK